MKIMYTSNIRNNSFKLIISLILLFHFSLNKFTYAQDSTVTGWFDPDSIATPITGDDSEWIIGAIGPNSAFDNARLMAMSVYDYYTNTTFGTYMGGTSEEDAGIYVIGYNHTTQKQIGPRAIYIYAEAPVGSRYDGHSYPHIVKSLDGHIHVFFCDQRGDGNNVHFRFNERGSITSDYTTEVLSYGGDGILGRSGGSLIVGEYPKPFVSRNGTMYFLSRSGPRTELYVNHEGESYRAALRGQVMVKSNDNGLTWEPAKIAIMRTNEEDYLTEPYLSQVIAEPARDGVEERIHFTWTMAAGISLWTNAEGATEYDYHNAHSKHLYHAYYVPAEDNFYSMDGTNLGPSIIDDELDTKCLVKESGDTVYNPPMSLEQYLEMRQYNTSIMGNFTIIDNNGEVYSNWRNHWNGSEWEVIDVDYPSDARVADWRNGYFYAYNGFSVLRTDDYYGNWQGVGSFNFTGTSLESRVGDISMEKSCPSVGNAHPEGLVWVKAYARTGRYDGFVMLGGHRTSYIPAKVIVEVEKGTVSIGEEVNVNAYIVDENGARILSADNSISFSSDIGTFSIPTSEAYQGLGKSVLTIGAETELGEHTITVSSDGLIGGKTYITVFGIDSIAPSNPDGLLASAASGSQINLTWNASTDDNAVRGYHVYRNGENIASVAYTNYSDKGLDPLTSYTYTVVAYDGSGNTSGSSNESSATTLEYTDETPPTSPSSVQTTSVTSSSIDIEWNASSDNLGVVGYVVYRNGDEVGTSTQTSFSDQGLVASTSYTYVVIAVDESGNESNPSGSLVAQTSDSGTVDPPPVTTSKTVYIDPENQDDSGEDGSFEHPFDSWADISWEDSSSYLIKKNTVMTIDEKVNITANSVIISSYGDGDKPIIRSNDLDVAFQIFNKYKITVSDLTFESNNTVSAIYILGYETDSVIVDNCSFSDFDFGVKMVAGKALECKNNLFKNNTSGIYAIVDNLEVYFNIFSGNYNALEILSQNAIGKISNNVMYNNIQGLSATFADIELYNNIFYLTEQSQYAIRHDLDNIISDYNLYFPDKPGFIQINSVSYGSISDVQQWTSQEANSIISDPMFVDVENNNFDVKDGSPVIDAGYESDAIKKTSELTINKPDIGLSNKQKLATSIDKANEEKLDIGIYPNPNNGRFYLNVPQMLLNEYVSNIQIISVSNQVLFNKDFTEFDQLASEEFDITGYVAGIYFVNVITSNNRKVTKSVIVY